MQVDQALAPADAAASDNTQGSMQPPAAGAGRGDGDAGSNGHGDGNGMQEVSLTDPPLGEVMVAEAAAAGRGEETDDSRPGEISDGEDDPLGIGSGEAEDVSATTVSGAPPPSTPETGGNPFEEEVDGRDAAGNPFAPTAETAPSADENNPFMESNNPFADDEDDDDGAVEGKVENA